MLKGPNTIFPYSIGKYIAEKFHSAKCINATCTGSPACHPTATQNKFGCDTHGSMVLRSINGTKPTTGTGTKTVINSHFSANFVRTVLTWSGGRVRQTTSPATSRSSSPRAPTRHGLDLLQATAHKDLINYGFLPTPFCGTGS